MRVQLSAAQIMLCAYTIYHAASPPLPAFGPEVSSEEHVRQATDWLLDSDYEDAHLCIAIGGAWAANNRQRGVEVAIRLQPALTIDRETALSGLSLLREAIEAVSRRHGAG